jgi:hypothetical protein
MKTRASVIFMDQICENAAGRRYMFVMLLTISGSVKRLPLGRTGKGGPVLVARGHVLVHEHVGEVGHRRADDGFAEEDRHEARLPEERDLAGIEHLDLLEGGLLAVAFVDAHLEQPAATTRFPAAEWQFEPRDAAEGAHERRFDTHERRAGGRRVEIGLAGLEIRRIGHQLLRQARVAVGGAVRDQHVGRRTVGTDGDVEHTHWSGPRALTRRQQRVLQVAVDERRGRPTPQRVAPQFVVVERRLCGSLSQTCRLRGCRHHRTAGTEGCCHEITSRHIDASLVLKEHHGDMEDMETGLTLDTTSALVRTADQRRPQVA